ncbi:MAG: type II toxin-antitoxin system prevent-host-death family antitoxin [Proteobacteria bacterium]|nr:type II toxin-antitoxin system prevent-host-death family antitoxin [Pseudomonadota bacterium]
MQISATEAKNRFGHICAQAKTEPVFVEKDGRPDSVILSYADYQALVAATQTRSLAQRRKEFNETYKDWIAEQNRDFEENGVWSDGLVAWRDQG